MVHLGPSGDSGPYTLSLRIDGYSLPQLLEDLGLLGPGPNQVHVALQDVEQLGELVEPVSPQEPPGPGDPRVVFTGPDLARVIAVHPHGAEFVDLEDPSALVSRPPIGARDGSASPGSLSGVQPHSILSIEHRPRGGEPHQEADEKHEREEEHNEEERHQDVQSTYRIIPDPEVGCLPGPKAPGSGNEGLHYRRAWDLSDQSG